MACSGTGQLGDCITGISVPATGEPDRYSVLNLGQLKIIQEVIALSVFVPFSVM